MRHWLPICTASFHGLRSLLPMIAALIAIRPEQSFIAASIPGLGPCKSTFCKAERPGVSP